MLRIMIKGFILLEEEILVEEPVSVETLGTIDGQLRLKVEAVV